MKTIEKPVPVSKALAEVWEWKEKTYSDVKDMCFEERREYYSTGLKKAVKLLKGKLKTNSDGSYSIVR